MRKGSRCLNCGESYPIETEYCPQCGQKNDDQKVSFGKLIFEFLSNYFSLDSRLGNSIVPFLFKPGYLTNRFREGKRVRYANPIRIYIIISIIYFFLISLLVRDLAVEVDQKTSPAELEKINEELATIDSTGQMQMFLAEEESQGFMEIDSATSLRLLGINWDDYQALKDQGITNEKQIADSLKLAEQPFLRRLVVQQLIRLDRAELESVTSYLAQNVSLMMFILLPLFAALLKLVYIRKRSSYYFEHLIHSLHLHSFGYLIFSIAIVLDLAWEVDVGFMAFLIFAVYIFFSMRAVYQQSITKTLLKLSFLSLCYIVLLLVGLLVEISVSLIMY